MTTTLLRIQARHLLTDGDDTRRALRRLHRRTIAARVLIDEANRQAHRALVEATR